MHITDDTSLRTRAEGLLRELAGPEARLRNDQWAAIEGLVTSGARMLVVQRTGWGKSAVYFIATALLRERGAGPTVIVSPLLALMRNQIAAAQRVGIRAHTINSSNVDEWDVVVAQVHTGAVDVLLVSPERLNNPDFRETVLPTLAASTGLLVVDEAHCISDWGHDFRPDYRRIRTVLAQLRPGIPVLATTATANSRVVTDVSEQLAAGAGEPTVVLRGHLERESLRLGVLKLPTAAHRLAWLRDHFAELTGAGIIYALTVAAVEEISAYLAAAGHVVLPYTGRTEAAERAEAESALLSNQVKALVATSALGMGYDKPDLGFVINVGAPPSPIAYYQQVGRAGRAVDRADVLLLPGAEDEAIWRYFGSLAFPPEEQVRSVLTALANTAGPISTPALESIVDLRRSRLETMLKVLDVDGAVQRVRGGWTATGQQWRYDAERYARIELARRTEQCAMRDYAELRTCRMEFLRRCLDDDAAAPCGRCDTCTEPWYPSEIAAQAVSHAQTALRVPGAQVAPRKQWPQGLTQLAPALKGRIPAGEVAETGRVLGRLSDIGWGTRLRALLASSASDAPVDDDVFAALVDVLTEWSRGAEPWSQRPIGIVTVPSRSRPQLVENVAARLGAVGRLPVLGAVSYTDGAPASARGNSAQRVRALYGAFAIPAELARTLVSAAGPVLLIDDRVDTGWTMAIVARLLRQHGASAVLPLALAAEA